MELLTHHLGQGLFLILLLSLPPILTAALTGLVVGILQAVTQVQEQTISTAPKIILVFCIIIFGGGVMMTMITNYIRESVVIAFNEIPHRDQHILPPLTRDERVARAAQFFGEDPIKPLKARPTLSKSAVNPSQLNNDGVAAAAISLEDRYQPNFTERQFLNKSS